MKSLPSCNSYNQYQDTNTERLISNLCTIFDKYSNLYKNSFLQYSLLKNATGNALDSKGVILNFNRNITFNDPLNVVHPKTEGITDYEVLYDDYKKCKLGDDAYRSILMLLSQTKNIPASVSNLSQVISDVINADVFVGDAMDMKYITYYFLDRIPGWLEVCMHNYDILPRPAGMAVKYISAISRFFGFLIQYPNVDMEATRKIFTPFWKSRFPSIFLDAPLKRPFVDKLPFVSKYKFTNINSQIYENLHNWMLNKRAQENQTMRGRYKIIEEQAEQAKKDRELIRVPGYTDKRDDPTFLWSQAMQGLNSQGAPNNPGYGAYQHKLATVKSLLRREDDLFRHQDRELLNDKRDLRHRLHYDPKTKWYYYKKGTAGNFNPLYQSTIYEDECGVWFAQDSLLESAKRGDTLVMRSLDYATSHHTRVLQAKDIPYFQKFQRYLTSCIAIKYRTAPDGTPLMNRDLVNKYISEGKYFAGDSRFSRERFSTPLVDPKTGGHLSDNFRIRNDIFRGLRLQDSGGGGWRPSGLPGWGDINRPSRSFSFDDYGHFDTVSGSQSPYFTAGLRGMTSMLSNTQSMDQCNYLIEILSNIHEAVKRWHQVSLYDARSFRMVLDFEYRNTGIIQRRNYINSLASKSHSNPYEKKYYSELSKIYNEYLPSKITDYSNIYDYKDTPIWKERQWLVYLRNNIKKTKDYLSRLYNRNAELYNKLTNKDDLPDDLYRELNWMRNQLGEEHFNTSEKEGVLGSEYSAVNINNDQLDSKISQTKNDINRHTIIKNNWIKAKRACEELRDHCGNNSWFGSVKNSGNWLSPNYYWDVKYNARRLSFRCYWYNGVRDPDNYSHGASDCSSDQHGTYYTEMKGITPSNNRGSDIRGCTGSESKFTDQISSKNTKISEAEREINKNNDLLKKQLREKSIRTEASHYVNLRDLMYRYYNETPELDFPPVELYNMPQTDLAII